MKRERVPLEWRDWIALLITIGAAFMGWFGIVPISDLYKSTAFGPFIASNAPPVLTALGSRTQPYFEGIPLRHSAAYFFATWVGLEACIGILVTLFPKAHRDKEWHIDGVGTRSRVVKRTYGHVIYTPNDAPMRFLEWESLLSRMRVVVSLAPVLVFVSPWMMHGGSFFEMPGKLPYPLLSILGYCFWWFMAFGGIWVYAVALMAWLGLIWRRNDFGPPVTTSKPPANPQPQGGSKVSKPRNLR